MLRNISLKIAQQMLKFTVQSYCSLFSTQTLQKCLKLTIGGANYKGRGLEVGDSTQSLSII